MISWLLAAGILDPSGNGLGLPQTSLDTGLKSGLTAVYTIVGALSVVFILVGAVQYVISGGDPASTKRAKETVMYAIIGLLVSLLAFGIVNVITSKVQ